MRYSLFLLIICCSGSKNNFEWINIVGFDTSNNIFWLVLIQNTSWKSREFSPVFEWIVQVDLDRASIRAFHVVRSGPNCLVQGKLGRNLPAYDGRSKIKTTFLDWITPFLLIYKKVVLFIFQPFISSDIRFHTHNTSIIRFISCAKIQIRTGNNNGQAAIRIYPKWNYR